MFPVVIYTWGGTVVSTVALLPHIESVRGVVGLASKALHICAHE